MTKEIFHITGHQHVRPVKRILARVLRRRQTKAERVFWQAVRAKRFHGFKFRRQQVVAGLVVDFYCPSNRLAVEIDGGIHVGREEEDRDREKVLTTLGVQTIRFTNEEVLEDMDGVLERLRRYLNDNSSPILPHPPRPPLLHSWRRGEICRYEFSEGGGMR